MKKKAHMAAAALFAAGIAFAARGGARTASLAADVSLEDCAANFWNPGCGLAGGTWGAALTRSSPTNAVPLGRNSTKLWCLKDFSKGYLYEDGNKSYATNCLNYTNHVLNFVGGADIPITENALLAVSNTLLGVREQGGTTIMRFAYTWDGYGGCEPDDFSMILTHQRQIAGVLNCFTDVLPAIECGIIGAYGEMHTSRYTDAASQKAIVTEWFDSLDPKICVLGRSGVQLFHYTGLTARRVYAQTNLWMQGNVARFGFFNDGYLGTDGDYGTWGSGSTLHFTREQACAFMTPHSRVPYGGEFATIDMNVYSNYCKTIYDPNKWNLVKEWYDTHLSYLRTIRSTGMTVYKLLQGLTFSREAYAWDGMPDLHEYEGVDLRTFCEDHMGFRYVVRWTGIDDALVDWSGGAGGIVLAIENTGFGSLLFDERYEVVLTKGGETVRIPCEIDVPLSSLAPAAIEERVFTFALPQNLASGDWRLHVAARAPLAGETDVLPRRPIRFANDGMWNESLRANFVGTLTVADSQAGGGEGGGSATNAADGAWFAVDLADAAYPAGTGWTSPAAEPAVHLGDFTENADSLSALDADERAVSLNGTEGVRYDPSAPCPDGAEVVVSGRIVPEESDSLGVPSLHPVAALGFMDGNAWLWDGRVWRRLESVGVPKFAADFSVTADFASTNAPRARVSVAGRRSDWIPLRSGTRLSAVVLAGEGRIWGFGGTYRLTAGGGVELVAPVFGGTDGAPAVAFDSAAKKFTVRISNGVEGAYYRALTATDLNGPWTPEGDAAQMNPDGTVTLTVDASAPAKFLKVEASGKPFDAGGR